MSLGRYGGLDKRKSPRFEKKFKVTLEYEGKTYQIRTINISRHGVQIPRRTPPAIGSPVKLTITIHDATSVFEGIVKNHRHCLVNGVKTTGIGIEIISPGYYEFVKDNIMIAFV